MTDTKRHEQLGHLAPILPVERIHAADLGETMNAVRRLEDFTDPDFDPFIADEAMFGACTNPYVKLAELRAVGPVHALNYRAWMGEPPDLTSADVEHFTVVGYDEVNLALRDPETFSNRAYLRNLGISFGRSVSTMDAPERQRYRKIFQKAFLPNIVSKWGESVVDPVIDSLMGKFVHRGSADLVREFTFHYPFQIVFVSSGCRPRRSRPSTSSPWRRSSSVSMWRMEPKLRPSSERTSRR
jgi:cytochrome P450